MQAESAADPPSVITMTAARLALWSVWVSALAFLVASLLFATDWWRATFHWRTPVTEAQARQVLNEVVGATLIEGAGPLCARYGTHPASSCATSVGRSGPPPGRAPRIRCITQVYDGPFAGSLVLTLNGRTDHGDPYLTDFLVMNQGAGPQPLDPIYWSNLNLTHSNLNPASSQAGVATSAWRFDGQSTRCT